jgi:hypothetical protein
MRPTAGAVEVPRAQVLAHRVRATGLDRPKGAAGGHGKRGPAGLPYLDLGIQDTPPGSAKVHWANRLGEPLDEGVFGRKQNGLDEVWSMRGSPHVHRTTDLQARAAAIWPLSDRDVKDRLGKGLVQQMLDAELAPRDAYRIAADAMAEAVREHDGPMPRGELSTAVTKAIPDELSSYCKGCEVVHISESLFRGTGLLGGLRIVRGTSPLELEPIPGWKQSEPDPQATLDLAISYLALLGPATVGDAADFVGTTKQDLAERWPEDGLTEVVADGRKACWYPEDELDDLLDAPEPELARFLAPGDPYLQGRDRNLVVPDRDHQKQIWKIIGNPGTVVVDGEVVGTWRPKASGKKVTLTVTPLKRITKAARAQLVEEEAPLVAAARGQEQADVRFEED